MRQLARAHDATLPRSSCAFRLPPIPAPDARRRALRPDLVERVVALEARASLARGPR